LCTINDQTFKKIVNVNVSNKYYNYKKIIVFNKSIVNFEKIFKNVYV